jgi:hypothetical protein
MKHSIWLVALDCGKSRRAVSRLHRLTKKEQQNESVAPRRCTSPRYFAKLAYCITFRRRWMYLHLRDQGRRYVSWLPGGYCGLVFNGRNIFRDQLSELLIAPPAPRQCQVLSPTDKLCQSWLKHSGQTDHLCASEAFIGKA